MGRRGDAKNGDAASCRVRKRNRITTTLQLELITPTSSRMTNQIIVYRASDGNELSVKTDGETVWLTQQQMCQLFGRDRSVITKHINNIFKEGELVREVVCAKYAHTTPHGAIKGKSQVQEVVLYNLDVIISVGYRVKSLQGTRFRQWATGILREMLLNRLDEVREIAKLKRRVDIVEGDIKQIKGGVSYLVKQLTEPSAPPRRRIGFDVKYDRL